MSRYRGLRHAAVAAAVLTLAACGASSSAPGASDTDSGATGVQVEADMFSGRENPQWTLTDVQLKSFSGCLAKTTPAAASPAADEGRLGFRGFVVRRLPASVPLVEMRILPSIATGTDAQGARVTMSGCEPLYALLRQSAAKHLSQAEMAGIPEGGQ